MAIVEREPRVAPVVASAIPTVQETLAPAPAGPTPQQRLDSARVRVRKVENTFRVELPAGVPHPPVNMVRALLPEKVRSRVTQREWEIHTIEQIVTKSVTAGVGTAQQWADAIGQALVQHVVSQDPEGFVAACGPDPRSMVELAAGAPAYMVIGGMAYKMTPVAAIDKSKPLDLLRKVARERGATEAATLIAAGKTEAQMLIRRADETKQEADRIKRDASRGLQFTIPEWGERIISPAGQWMYPNWRRNRSNSSEFPMKIQLEAVFKPTTFYIETPEKKYTWTPLIDAVGYVYKFWLPLNPATGRFTVAACALDSEGEGNLPHMTYDRLCGTIEGLPGIIKGYEEVDRIRRAIERVMNGVNLGSPLARWDDFGAKVRKLLPVPVAAFFRGSLVGNDLFATSNESESQTQVLKDTWNL